MTGKRVLSYLCCSSLSDCSSFRRCASCVDRPQACFLFFFLCADKLGWILHADTKLLPPSCECSSFFFFATYLIFVDSVMIDTHGILIRPRVALVAIGVFILLCAVAHLIQIGKLKIHCTDIYTFRWNSFLRGMLILFSRQRRLQSMRVIR